MKTTFQEPQIVTRKGKAVSVILSIKDFEELLERVEDAEDMAALKRARAKPLRYRTAPVKCFPPRPNRLSSALSAISC